VILPVFKTGGRQVCPVAGGFDPHSLPPLCKQVQAMKSRGNQVAVEAILTGAP
jgi:hypothetical protein